MSGSDPVMAMLSEISTQLARIENTLISSQQSFAEELTVKKAEVPVFRIDPDWLANIERCFRKACLSSFKRQHRLPPLPTGHDDQEAFGAVCDAVHADCVRRGVKAKTPRARSAIDRDRVKAAGKKYFGWRKSWGDSPYHRGKCPFLTVLEICDYLSLHSLARFLDVQLSTVHSWRHEGSIPEAYVHQVAELFGLPLRAIVEKPHVITDVGGSDSCSSGPV